MWSMNPLLLREMFHTFGCAACGDNQVVLCCGLKLANMHVGSGTSCEGPWYKLSSAIECAVPVATW